ncbi:MAG: hypothetical protein ACYDBT_00415 [Desulfobulbaceae bacterium]
MKVGRHAWNVYPLESFGYLLGRPENEQVLVALPCSKTSRWYDYSDRWVGICQYLSQAKTVAADFGLEVVGFYASTQNFADKDYPTPCCSNESSMGIVMIYHNICCPSCSRFLLFREGVELAPRDEFIIPRGKRACGDINQRRVHHAWLAVHSIEYSNGFQEYQNAVLPTQGDH